MIAGLLFWEIALPRLKLRNLTRRTRARRFKKIGQDFRKLAVQMGGVLIKVGQFLSARVDVLPEEITDELAGLQDEVPPENFEAILQLAEQELDAPLHEKYLTFERTPVAAASLGQVHRAKMFLDSAGPLPTEENDGKSQDVVVKIQRPNIELIIQTDLAALQTVGRWIQHYPLIRNRADVPSLLKEFTTTLYEEIDYLAEGRNIETFKANFESWPDIKVPDVIWTHTTRRVLTLENVYAIKITNYESITSAGISRPAVAKRLFETYMKQIFVDGFLHADPHPGNLFVEALPLSEGGNREWKLTFVDFGMVTDVKPKIRHGLREMAIGIGTRDPERLVTSYQILGLLLPEANLDLLKEAEAKMFDRVYGKSMRELGSLDFEEMKEFALEFRELIYSLPFQVPQDMIYLGRTVAILSGMCTGLDPNFNFWDNIEPFAKQFVIEETTTNWEYWLGEIGEVVRVLASMPRRIDHLIEKMEQGKLEVKVPEVKDQVTRLEHTTRRLVGAIIFSALILSGVQVYLAGHIAAGAVILTGAGLALLWVLLTRS
jgi:predicted unusual protein kinase regulating ubiquinone biosynthesis (AarF/ABC1/UbiB family)